MFAQSSVEEAAVSSRSTRSKTASKTNPKVHAVPEAPSESDEQNGSASGTIRTISGVSLLSAVSILPLDLKSTHTKLNPKDHGLLKKKQEWLKTYDINVPKQFKKHQRVAEATLVFSQEEAGTAICISPEGLLLTCAHCIAENEDDLDKSQTHWLLFCSGLAVAAKCTAWDARRDLALLQVVAAQSFVPAEGFPSARIACAAPETDSRIICIGHPGSEDLEASHTGIKTNYDVLSCSTGCYRGCASGQDPHDNSEIGALMHDAWTYWGHSGAPLFCLKTGQLMGLHSSWDAETGMRRGVSLVAIRQFVHESMPNTDQAFA
ncbi:uncharacterized protein JN550_009056 [Neoarthrinium moseri]|uniref:uncharacterized protein n=1 Tax=Neoarthrinium moseri TaxID=1658444 RepID=UPI001FDD727E|nr:uncharacterized protein JN550_009056 [Neoarthrinium moseri]KAI1864036.1 hypothetical protein JN550_009056 [Neoarthrinium moseri]